MITVFGQAGDLWINMRYYNFIKFEDYKGRKDKTAQEMKL